jgi:amino acid adenylation domain-containing protein
MNKDSSPSKPSLLSRWKNRDNKSLQETGIPKISDTSTIPLSREQERLWFLQQLNPTNSFYNYSDLYRLEGNIDVTLLEKSIRFIEDKHDILRSRYYVEQGVPTVKITPEACSKFTFHDFSDNSYDIASQKAAATLQKSASHTFQLADETLLQATVIKVASDNYLLLLLMHHIITDKWSMAIFQKELADNYTTLVEGSIPVIEKPEIQYGSYAHWQVKQPINEDHLSYWKQKLSGEIPTLNLTTDRPKKAQPSYKGTFDKQNYKAQTSEAFFKLCKKIEATPYVTMLSVFYVLLQKYSGQRDILVGTPITKREQMSLENLIGFFNDTLVLRTYINNSASFKTIVEEVKKTTLEAFSNKDISFHTLVKTINPSRSLSVHPFFQVMFLYNKVSEIPILGDNIKSSFEPYDAGVAKFDLSLYISEDKGSLMSLMEYATDIFESSTIERMHKHFKRILNIVIENPDVILSEINTYTEQEIQFHKTQEAPIKEYSIPCKGIHDIIASQSEKRPEAIALVFKNHKTTYLELNEKANKLAFQLIDLGVQKNDIVGLCIERSHNMIIGLLGILKAGAAYLPLDPEYPSDRISHIFENASAKVLITQSKYTEKYNNLSIKIHALDIAADLELSNKVSLPKVESSDLAYVIYTSGSTGTPKGVPLTHKNIINSTLARTDFYGVNPSSFLVMSSIAFDSSKAGIFWSLCTGGTLVISEKNLEQDIDRLVNTIYKNSVSHTLMLPSLYAQMIQYGDWKKLRSLDTVIVAGEACATQVAASHFKILPEVNLYNEYGPTESTVWCIAHKLAPKDVKSGSIPIGRPIKNIQVFILDEDRKRVPYGTAGELHIGGLGLAKGYLNDQEKTSQSFIQHPFDRDTSKRLYKTGDLTKYTADGMIAFLGRKDEQVKIRGYRIELNEIEQLIYSNTSIEHAIVTVDNEIEAINWEALEEETPEKLMQLLNKHITNREAEEILTSIEKLPEETLDVILNNLD